MVFNKPWDIAVSFAIFGLIVVTVGYGITDIITHTGASGNTTYYDSVEVRLTGDNSLKNTTDNVISGAQLTEGGSEADSQENFILQGGQALFSLGQTWSIAKESIDEGLTNIGLPAIYWNVIIGVLALILVMLIYTWIRGT